MDRYCRQVILPQLGRDGQKRLAASTVSIVGCGALGSTLADLLVRAGVGRVVVIDRDIVETVNLHRQVLYDEDDVALCLPKAEAARRKLARVNSEVEIAAHVVDLTPHNALSLLDDADLVLDGTDNVETRYLLNDVCLERGIPWVYGGAVGTQGMTMTILPGEGPCLRCLFPEPPAPGSLATCETAGVLNTVPVIVAAQQASEAVKILTGSEAVSSGLLVIDPWEGSYRRVAVRRALDCPACVQGKRDFLDGFELTEITRLCGQNAVQIDPVQDLGVSLDALHERLSRLGKTSYNGHVLRFWAEPHELLIFPDARAIVKGTTDPAVARTVYAKYVGA